MDINVDTLYLSKGNRSTNIVYINQSLNIPKVITTVLNEACLSNLSTLEGRVNAVKENYNIRKYVPIYVNNDIILQPLNSIDDWNYTLINIVNVVDIYKESDKTVIRFVNNEILKINEPTNRILQYFEKCKKIRLNQLKADCKRGI